MGLLRDLREEMGLKVMETVVLKQCSFLQKRQVPDLWKKNVCSGTLNVLPLKAEYVHRSLFQYSFHQYPEQK